MTVYIGGVQMRGAGHASRVYVGGAQAWDTGLMPRQQVCKMNEEVMEVFSAVELCESEDLDPEAWHRSDSMHFRVVDECCDVITATCNLLSMLGVTDLREAMERCAERNRKRGRL